MRRWEWSGSRWVYRLPAIPAWAHFGALVAGLVTYGFGWLAHLFFCAVWLLVRNFYVCYDPRTTEEIYAEELRQPWSSS